MTVGLWLAVAAVGGCGAVARFLLDSAIGARVGRPFPFGTFTINLSGAFLLGILTGLDLTPAALLVAGTATIGSYTTFSTWMLESQRLTEEGDARGAALNLLVSLVLGAAVAALGLMIGAHL
ncbi:MAG TPA: fluoride efflux transporter CrcB [Solirubrobacteraceae bacterium]|nr:fluoride efflux transporter CrcB [Solirubrobacteraceae bacterium]